MLSTTQNQPISRKQLWTSRIMVTLVALFMAFDGVIHVIRIPAVDQAFTQLGFPSNFALTLGIIQLLCLAAYVVPRTSIIGAILLTAYLGGAIATNVRVGTPLFSNALFPVYVAILLWGGLFLRDGRLRGLFSLRGQQLAH
jgi:hypothetical protein